MANLFEKLAGNLLDLGLRNKLLNFKDQKLRSIEIVEPDSDELFSLICSDSNAYFIEPKEEEDEENQLSLITIDDIDEPIERKTNEIIAYKRGEKFDYILKHLKKFNDSAQIEKGINILYVSFGMLNWKEADFSKYDLKSPLLLIPVMLDYDKGKQAYYIKRLEEEIIVNPALKSKLDFDFKVLLPDFVPDEDNIESYLAKVEEMLPEDSWMVDNKTYLGIFSFAKITMYNDLKTNESKMSSSPLIKAIYNGDDSQFENYFNTDYDEFFNKGEDVKLYNVVDADSSQIEAILEAKKGKSFVIQGPPGTGKSQTITNIIAELLNDGKKVLFVSEKKAALDVVFNNLKRVGLDDFCFQVHSDKMNKKDFVQELYRVLHSASRSSIDREARLNELKEKKEKLDRYCKVLYKNVEPLNVKIYDIVNAVHLYKKYERLTYKITDIKTKDLTYLAHCKEALERFALYDGPSDIVNFPWYGFDSEQYNYQNDKQIIDDFSWGSKFVKELNELASYILKCTNNQYSTVESMQDAVMELKYIIDMPYHDVALLSSGNRKKIISSLEELGKTYSSLKLAKESVFSLFEEEIYDINVEEYKNRFLNNYRSIFRIFNRSYKSDRDDLLKYVKSTSKKVGYKELCYGLKNASNYTYLQNKLDKKLQEVSSLTSFKYDVSNFDSVAVIVAKLKDFDKKYPTLNVSLNEETKINELAENIYKLTTLATADIFEKYHSLQSYFLKEYVDFANKEFNFVEDKLNSCIKHAKSLIEWVRFCSVWLPVERLGLSLFISYAINNDVNKSELADAYSYCFYKEWMMVVYYENEELKYFRRSTQDLTVKQFKQLDKELLQLDRKQIACSIKNKLYTYVNGTSQFNYYGHQYNSNPVARRELSILEHEANKKRAIKPIRVMFREIPNLLYRIKPCLLMSPLSVATYLTYNPESFDVVIFDEASQIFPWDAIGAISRCKATIVVGDSKQMPPTNFFMASTGYDDDYDEEEEESAADFESILDLCTAVLPQKMLNWHYRSKTESLIAFSNRNFYRNRLVTFPSSQHDSDDFGIKFHYVSNGVFVNRQNIKEAEAVADLIYEHFRKHPERSLGVVCFSINQQALLEDIIDERRRRNDLYAKFFDQTINEPFFVKNLETVQGDERDTIIFSIGYGKDAAGNLKHNFGPLNRKGGERRLNVAITRAKYNVQVVSSIRSFDIDLNRTSAEGARLLKEYLDLAENGLASLNKDLFVNPDAEADSSFEEDVANAIREAGYKVDLQVGCSGYRIDLCVKHPKNNDYVLAVECDGRTYHSSKNARDRDRLRQEVLERLGWKFYRIWSTDWFINCASEKKALIQAIEKAVLDYDIVAKEVEERNKITAETRYKDVVENVRTSSKSGSGDLLSDRGNFTDLLIPQEVEYIKKFNSELEKSAYKFIFDEREFIYAYKLKSDVEQGKKKAWFWIGKSNDKLVFKIKDDPDDIKPSREFNIGKKDGAIALAQYVLDLCEKKHKIDNRSVEVPSSQSVDVEEDEVVDSQTHIKNERFFFLIAKAIQGRRVYCRTTEESNIVNEVLEFVMNEISYDAMTKGFFKNKQEFDQYKYSRRFTYNFFTVTFSLGNVSIAKAEEIYYYYVATKAVSVIKSYEKIFNKKIIEDSRELLRSLFQMIRANEVDVSRCSGLNSNFILVPDSTVSDEIEKYLKYCRQ